jgi:hypothetical protein
MRRFVLNRTKDISGISGTGIVAEGVVFPSGRVVIEWYGSRPSIVIWQNLEDPEFIHGHGGATTIDFID